MLTVDEIEHKNDLFTFHLSDDSKVYLTPSEYDWLIHVTSADFGALDIGSNTKDFPGLDSDFNDSRFTPVFNTDTENTDDGYELIGFEKNSEDK